MIDVWITKNQWLSLKVAAMIDPDCMLDWALTLTPMANGSPMHLKRSRAITAILGFWKYFSGSGKALLSWEMPSERFPPRGTMLCDTMRGRMRRQRSHRALFGWVGVAYIVFPRLVGG